MEKVRNYNLTGLNILFICMLLSFVPGIALGVFSHFSSGTIGLGLSKGNVFYLSTLGVSLLLVILEIVGLSLVSKYSNKLRKARNLFVINAVVSVGILALVVGGIFAAANSINSRGEISNTGNITMLVCMALAAIFSIFSAVVSLLMIKNLMGGCAEIAKECGDKKYAFRCTRTWIEYWILYIATIITAVIVTVVAGNAMVSSLGESGGNIKTLMKINNMAGDVNKFLVPATLVIILLTLIIYFVMIFRIRGTYSRFHMVRIGEDEEVYLEVESDNKIEEIDGKTALYNEFHVTSPIDSTPSPLDQVQSGVILNSQEEINSGEIKETTEDAASVVEIIETIQSEETEGKKVEDVNEDIK